MQQCVLVFFLLCSRPGSLSSSESTGLHLSVITTIFTMNKHCICMFDFCVPSSWTPHKNKHVKLGKPWWLLRTLSAKKCWLWRTCPWTLQQKLGNFPFFILKHFYFGSWNRGGCLLRFPTYSKTNKQKIVHFLCSRWFPWKRHYPTLKVL